MRENRSWEFNWRKTQLSPAGAEAELGNISLEKKIVNIVCIFCCEDRVVAIAFEGVAR